jgi:hypothetical protein
MLCSAQGEKVSSRLRSFHHDRERTHSLKGANTNGATPKPTEYLLRTSVSSQLKLGRARSFSRTHMASASTANSSEHPSSATKESVPMENAEPQKPYNPAERVSQKFGAGRSRFEAPAIGRREGEQRRTHHEQCVERAD